MHPAAVVCGLLCLMAGGALSGVGVYDGVLNQSDIETLPPPGTALDVTLRIGPAGAALPARSALEPLESRGSLMVPQALREAMAQGGWLVPVTVDQTVVPHEAPILLRSERPQLSAPRIVVEGQITVHYVLIETEGGPETAPIILLEPRTQREPVLFD